MESEFEVVINCCYENRGFFARTCRGWTRTAKQPSKYHKNADGSERTCGRRSSDAGCFIGETKLERTVLASAPRSRQTAEAIFFCSSSSASASGAGSMLCKRSGRAARKL